MPVKIGDRMGEYVQLLAGPAANARVLATGSAFTLDTDYVDLMLMPQYFSYDIDSVFDGAGTLEVYEVSAKDGSEIHSVKIPVEI